MAARQVSPRVVALSALLVVAAVVLVATWPRGTADIPVSAPDRSRDLPGVAQADSSVPPPLGLEEMSGQRATPANRRDLFRFGSAQPAPGSEPGGEGEGAGAGPGRGRTAVQARQPDPVVQQGPPQPPPIPLRYVLYAESPQTGKLAALSDGRFTYQGHEGDVIDGKWRIVKIGAASVVIERVDGTGRQTLPLAGGG